MIPMLRLSKGNQARRKFPALVASRRARSPPPCPSCTTELWPVCRSRTPGCKLTKLMAPMHIQRHCSMAAPRVALTPGNLLSSP